LERAEISGNEAGPLICVCMCVCVCVCVCVCARARVLACVCGKREFDMHVSKHYYVSRRALRVWKWHCAKIVGFQAHQWIGVWGLYFVPEHMPMPASREQKYACVHFSVCYMCIQHMPGCLDALATCVKNACVYMMLYSKVRPILQHHS
jgi:hypothetical protein